MADYSNHFWRNHVWLVKGKVGDLSVMADEAIKDFERRSVRLNSLIVCGPGDSEKLLASVDLAKSLERITVKLDYAVGVEVDATSYVLHTQPEFDVAAKLLGGVRQVWHMHGFNGGTSVRKEPGPFWLAFVGPLYKDGSKSGPEPPKTLTTPAVPLTSTPPPAARSWAAVTKG